MPSCVSLSHQTEILSLSINNEVHPKSTVQIMFHNKILSRKSNTQTLEYLIPSVNCNDKGTYVCTGNNTYNTGQRATLDNTLYVICSPRRSLSFELKQNVTSALNDSATFQFTIMAYPPPRFQWYRIINGSETSENHAGVITSHSISTNEMQINFTMHNVEEIHYGQYLLNVENQYGAHIQTFYLLAAELQLSETLTQSKSVGPAVGGTVGALFAVITVTVSLLIVRKRKTCKRTSAQIKASNLYDLHTYKNFQNDDQSSSEGASPAVYERLHHTDHRPDQQYQQLATFAETEAPNKKVYENLKLSQQNKENNVGGSSESSQNAAAHNQRPV